eukprot:1136551-Pelagomonas_calceolata.AAC.4
MRCAHGTYRVAWNELTADELHAPVCCIQQLWPQQAELIQALAGEDKVHLGGGGCPRCMPTTAVGRAGRSCRGAQSSCIMITSRPPTAVAPAAAAAAPTSSAATVCPKASIALWGIPSCIPITAQALHVPLTASRPLGNLHASDMMAMHKGSIVLFLVYCCLTVPLFCTSGLIHHLLGQSKP